MFRNDYQVFQDALRQIYPNFGDKAMDYLIGETELLKVKSKTHVIESRKVQSSIFFMTNGLIRGYYIDDKGNDITVRFIDQHGWVTHYSALISSQPSAYYFQTLEPSTLLDIKFQTILEGYRSYEDINTFGRLIAEKILSVQQGRIESFQFRNAEERYLDFMTTYPDLYNRVSLSHLSSYLGIKRQSLSRIRQKMVQR